MDQLGVVTSVLVLSTLLVSLEDIRRLWRGRNGKADSTSPISPAPEAQCQVSEPPAGDLMAAVLSDLESDDERRVGRGLSLVEKVPAATIAPRLIQMLRHPRDEVSARAAKALLQMNAPESLEPLYLYFTARGSTLKA
ncbi:MAG: hypothetical protein HY303_04030 [Candidatus Wallbacteria bacterium]|nr:hypothetical protein [Candidatus Wallbacteria bacterium]